MDLQNFTLFAAAGSLFAFWQQIKGFIVRVFSLVIKTDEIPEHGMAENFLKEILPHLKLIKWGNTVYLSEQLYFPSQKTWANLFFTYFKSYPALYKKTPIILSESGDYGLKVTYLSWTFNIRKILENVNNKNWLTAVPSLEYLLDDEDSAVSHHDYDIEDAVYFYPNSPLGNDFCGRIIYQQFTGLLDKNGREIYEGDICKWQWAAVEGQDKEVTGEVFFEDGIFYFGREYFCTADVDFDELSLEVIGNIFESAA